jgi:hypothetical protein
MNWPPEASDGAALLACQLRGDEAGADVILDGCDLRAVVKFFMGFSAAALRQASGHAPDDTLVQGTDRLLLRIADESRMPPSGEDGGGRGFTATS